MKIELVGGGFNAGLIIVCLYAFSELIVLVLILHTARYILTVILDLTIFAKTFSTYLAILAKTDAAVVIKIHNRYLIALYTIWDVGLQINVMKFLLCDSWPSSTTPGIISATAAIS